MGDAEVGLDAVARAAAERVIARAVVAVEEGHVIGDGRARDGHAGKHADALCHVHERQLLGRRHDDRRRELHRLWSEPDEDFSRTTEEGESACSASASQVRALARSFKT